MMRSIGSWLLLLSCVGCALPSSRQLRDFDWTVGRWQGVRRDQASGSDAPIAMRVEPLFGANGQLRTLAIESSSGSIYRGTAVQLFDPESGRWSWQYTNSPGRAFARYVGPEGVGEPVFVSEWHAARAGMRISRLLSERLADGRWQRTMQRSGDGGENWQTLWVDTLRRQPE